MGKIALIESQPLLRLGLRQILQKLDGAGEPLELDSSCMDAIGLGTGDVDFLIYGIPVDMEEEYPPLADVCRRLTPKRILLLMDSPPLPSSVQRLPVYGAIKKTVSIEILEAAIRLVMAGGQCFPGMPIQPPAHQPAIAPGRIAVSRAMAADAEAMAKSAQMLHLTPRQYEVLVLLARGHPIKLISRMLNISVATAKTHACTLYQRLHVRNKGEAVYAALQRGVALEWRDAQD
ncbi:response regulator transcription factor [Pigmentiphaga soli]|uniref:Response regulator transcription factor n=1 Tax=Pigmentiphaga soli TaxID=1007095 RepID=A0ABP8HD97_9BURK